jgi:hypothetical protein
MGNVELETNNLRTELYETARLVGIKILSDDDCCRVLAWLYTYGGGREATVHDNHLRDDIFEAQKRLNIFGGETPNRLIFLMKKYISEITGGNGVSFFIGEDHEAYDRYRNPPEWVFQLEKKYGIKSVKPAGDGKK